MDSARPAPLLSQGAADSSAPRTPRGRSKSSAMVFGSVSGLLLSVANAAGGYLGGLVGFEIR